MAMLGEFPACWENFKHSTDIKKKIKTEKYTNAAFKYQYHLGNDLISINMFTFFAELRN
jgi:hypothetical protein